MNRSKTKIVLLNQMAGPLFRELAEDLAQVWSPSLLYTGHPHTTQSAGNDLLNIHAGPEYDRRGNLRRLLSWLKYFISAMWITLRQPNSALLFIVSNPPFLGLLGLFLKLLRGQKYVVLVYDIYPDLLLNLGIIRRGLISGIWYLFNRLVFENAGIVFTIGDDMANLLESKYNMRRTIAGRVVVIPNWADVTLVKPIPKPENWFAVKYGQVDKTTVLYSGNMGNSHDIETILNVAGKLKEYENIHFLFIGEGVKWSLVEKTIKEQKLSNITLLPFQPESVLPFSMAAGDIGIVAYQEGTEACIVPSKAYYYMAAGLVPLVISAEQTCISKMLTDNGCGFSVCTGDLSRMAQVILNLAADRVLLRQYQNAARKYAENHFSRRNTEQFVEIFRYYNCVA